VLYTKPRNEKKLTHLLSEKNVTVYCPLKDEIRQWSDRKKKISSPVFTSYIFVLINDYKTESVNILNTPGALHFLWWNKKPAIVRDEEINMIKEFLSAYKYSDLVVEIIKGDKVLIHEGPLKDNKGIVVKIKGNKAYLKLVGLGIEMIATMPAQSLRKI
jgi:transcription antitermination factor NusG